MSAENDAEKAALKEDLEVNMPPNEADPPAASNAAAKMDPETEPLNAAANPKVEFKSKTLYMQIIIFFTTFFCNRWI